LLQPIRARPYGPLIEGTVAQPGGGRLSEKVLGQEANGKVGRQRSKRLGKLHHQGLSVGRRDCCVCEIHRKGRRGRQVGVGQELIGEKGISRRQWRAIVPEEVWPEVESVGAT